MSRHSTIHSIAPLPAVTGRKPGAFMRLAPGLLITALIATAAFALHDLRLLPGLSPLILAIIIGMAGHNLIGTPAQAKAGIAFSLRRVLRAAIVLLGFQLTLADIREVGLPGLATILICLTATFFFTLRAGRWLGVERPLAGLIASGTSICGASAVIAANAVIEGRDEDVAYAVACVTVFGSLSMLLYPLIEAHLVALSPAAYGLWTGATVHEIAQVVAAGFQAGQDAGEAATVSKLTRVLMLAPVCLALALFWNRSRPARQGVRSGSAPMPWFALGFLAVVVLNSYVTLPKDGHDGLVSLTTFLLSMALAAMGLETDIAKLRARGLRPLALGALSWLFISTLGLALVLVAG
ncbi:MAG: YeiH family protein [Parvibaculaceae bacterium]|nr:YeiH family protein [Parvibaculaceae bacterium]